MAVTCDDDGVFPLRRRFFVLGHDSPAILLVDEDIGHSHVEHRFDGEDHTGDDEHTTVANAHMLYFRLLVKFEADSMTTEVSDHREMVFPRQPIDGVADPMMYSAPVSDALYTLLGNPS